MLERGRRVIELEGPHRVTPNKIAAAFSKILGRHIRMEAVPRERREALFTSQGMKNPLPRIQMLDGFNEGWIEFEGGMAASLKGKIELETVVKALVEHKVEGFPGRLCQRSQIGYELGFGRGFSDGVGGESEW